MFRSLCAYGLTKRGVWLRARKFLPTSRDEILADENCNKTRGTYILPVVQFTPEGLETPDKNLIVSFAMEYPVRRGVTNSCQTSIPTMRGVILIALFFLALVTIITAAEVNIDAEKAPVEDKSEEITAKGEKSEAAEDKKTTEEGKTGTADADNSTKAANNSAAEEDKNYVDKKFDQHGVPVCVKPKCKGRECKTPCHNGRCHKEGQCVCDDCWEGETCNAYNQSDECTEKLERQYPQEPEHDEDEHDMSDNPYTEDDTSTETPPERRPKKRKKRSKRRRKRATVTYPTSMKFTLTKTGPIEGKIGTKVHFKLTIELPQKDNQDLDVELFTPVTATTPPVVIMLLYNVKISHKGDKITQDKNVDLLKLKATMDARVGVYPHDRAILKIGPVSVAAGATDKQQLELWIEFDAIMIACKEEAKTYWVSAGAEYNNENEIWVGQASFKTKGCSDSTLDPTLKPKCTLDNSRVATGIPVGKSGEVFLEVQIPHWQVDLAIDAIAPLGTTNQMSICGVLVYSSGTSYHCIPKDIFQYKNYKDAKGKCSARARLEVEKATNAGKRIGGWAFGKEDTIKFGVYVMFEKSVPANSEHWLGVAVEFGKSTICALQTKIKALAASTSYLTDTTPKVSLVANSSDKAPVGGAVAFVLKIDTTELKTSDFTVEFLMPFEDGQARMHICNIEICATGWNVPCAMADKPTFTSRAKPADSNMDRVVMKLGHITNNAILSQNGSASTVTVCLYASIITHTKNVKDAKMWVTAGVTVMTTKLWVGMKEITVIGDLPFDTTKAPVMTSKYGFGDENQYVNALADYRFEIATKGLWKYSMMDVEIMLPFASNAAVLSICSAEILFAGKNLPCFQRDAKNKDIKYHSKANNLVYDRATVAMGTMYNIKDKDPNTTNDKIVVRVVVKVEDHPATNASATGNAMISSGIQYDKTSLWVGQLNMVVKKGTNVPLTPVQAAVLVMELKSSDGNKIKQGESKSLHLTVKFPPQSVADYELMVKTDKDQSMICRFAFQTLGHNMNCTDKDIKPTYTQFPGGAKGNKDATIKLGRVTNPGGEKLNGLESAKASIVFAVAVKVTKTLATGSTVNIEAVLSYYEGSTAKTKSSNILALTVEAAGVMTTLPNTRPGITMHRAPMLDYTPWTPPNNELVKGQHFRCFLDIVLKPDSCVQLTVKILGPLGKDGVLDIVNLRVWGLGSGMPCSTVNGGVEAKITKRTGSKSFDVATLEIGQVCTFAKQGSLVAERKIQIEAISRVRVVDNPLNVGGTFWLSAVTKMNTDQIHVTQLMYVIKEKFVDIPNPNKLANASIFFDTGVTLINKKIHETFTVKAVVMVPPNSTCKANMDVKAEMDDTATLNIKEVKITRCGANLKGMCNNPNEFKPTYSSTQKTSQKDKTVIDLIVVTNTGVTYRKMAADPQKDDSFDIEVTATVLDSKKMNDKVGVWLSVGVKICTYILLIDKKVTIVRDNKEKPVYKATAKSDKSTYDKKKKEIIHVSGTLEHDPTSKAEGQNVHLKFFISMKILEYAGNFKASLPPKDVNFTKDYFTVKWDKVFFTDVITLSFDLGIKPDATLPSNADSGLNTIPYVPGSDMHTRAGNAESNDFIPSDMKSFSFTLTSMKGPPKTCTPVDLKLNDKTAVKDCQLSTSTEGAQATLIRKSSTGLLFYSRPGGYEEYRYFGVIFSKKTMITGVTFYKPSSASCEVTKFKVKYSNDLMGWVEGKENAVTAYSTAGAKTTVADGESGAGRAIRVYLTADNCNMPTKKLVIQADLFGCDDPNQKPVTAQDPCTFKPLSSTLKVPGSATYTSGPRGFVSVATDKKMYYCDTLPYSPFDKYQMKTKCYSSADKGTNLSTKELPQIAFNIIAYHTVLGELYGTSPNGAFVMSSDAGKTFFSIPKERWEACKKDAKCAKATNIPFDTSSTTPVQATIQQNYVGASSAGLFLKNGGSWEKVTDWTKCCT